MIKTGSEELNDIIEGYNNELSLIYGPPGSGKTTLCKLACSNVIKENKKVIYIDTENGFSSERFRQIVGENYFKLLDNLLLIKVKTFEDQCEKIENLKQIKNVSLIILDSVGKFFRSKVKENHKEVNKELVGSLETLREISKRNIPILITSQIYTDINNNKIIPVGGEIIKRFCKKIIELQITPRKLTIIKPDKKEMLFQIIDKGVKLINP